MEIYWLRYYHLFYVCARKFADKMMHVCMILVPEDVYNMHEQKQKLKISPITMNM